MACFCGLPAFISARMLAEMVFLDEPFLSGMASTFLILCGITKRDENMRFESEEEIDAFVDALGQMLYEFALAYKAGDQSFDRIGDSIEDNVSHLAALAKVAVGLSGR